MTRSVARRAAMCLALSVTAVAAAITLHAGTVGAQAPGSDDGLQRGRYLVEVVMQCGSCHAMPGGGAAAAQAGGRVFISPNGRAVTPNITPDAETGIGRWTAADFAEAMRNGRRPDGSLIGPPMPIEAYRGVLDRDLAAIWAYLGSLPPVRHEIAERSAFTRVPTRFEPPVVSVSDPPADDRVRRGEYLAVALAHCMDCHSPRISMDRADPARVGAGGRVFHTPAGPVPARNITPHPEAGIGAWSDAQLWQTITTGLGADGRRLHIGMTSRAAGWARMTEQDRADLLAYLRALPALE